MPTNVGLGFVRLKSPVVVTRSSKASLHLVRDTNTSVAANHLKRLLHVAFWVLHSPADALQSSCNRRT